MIGLCSVCQNLQGLKILSIKKYPQIGVFYAIFCVELDSEVVFEISAAAGGQNSKKPEISSFSLKQSTDSPPKSLSDLPQISWASSQDIYA